MENNQMKYPKIIYLCLLISGALYAAEDKSAFVTDKCGSCHKVSKLCKHIGKYDSAAWFKLTENMVKFGAKISADENREISDYLASLKADNNPVCK
jgi:hypothetical protein